MSAEPSGNIEFESFPIYFALKRGAREKFKRDTRLLCEDGVYESRLAAKNEYQRQWRAKHQEGKTVAQREEDKDAALKKALKAAGNQISLAALKRKMIAAGKLERKCQS